MGFLRPAAGAATLLVAGVLAGCSGSATVDDVTLTSTSAATSTSASAPPPPAGSVAPTSSGSATTTGSVSLTPPPAPSVPSSYPGGFTLTTGGTPITGYLTAVDCGQDGSMTSDQLTLAPGATSVTLKVQPVPGSAITIAGTGTLDAAGGVFHGADTRGAITVVWTC